MAEISQARHQSIINIRDLPSIATEHMLLRVTGRDEQTTDDDGENR